MIIILDNQNIETLLNVQLMTLDGQSDSIDHYQTLELFLNILFTCFDFTPIQV